jgi:CheY-like chemotaxis protein
MTTNKWILLAEDNANDADLVMRSLLANKPAARVVLVTNGAAALEYLHHAGGSAWPSEHLPSLVLLDLKMPKVDGLEVLRQIKNDHRLKMIPIVMFTSSREESDVRRSYQLGANAYVVKPVEFRQLVATVQTLHSFWISLNETPPEQDRRTMPARSAIATAA